jgi:hypothetical protein
MPRAAYYREQARLCRRVAGQVTAAENAARLREMAEKYEAEANAVERDQVMQEQQK